MTKKVIILYDYTSVMAQPWLRAGYEVWTFDGQHPTGITRDGDLVKVGMWFYHDKTLEQAKEIRDMVGEGVEVVFGFPECTHLTNAGSRHWAKKRAANPNFQVEAMELCLLVEKVGNQYEVPWAFENPVGVLSSMYRTPDYYFDPKDYGQYLPEDDVHPIYPQIYPPRDQYNKKTCIWMGNGAKQPLKKPLPALHKANPGWALCGGKSTKTKNIRSCTPRGFAEAFFHDNQKVEDEKLGRTE
ncbi:hypothetical protein pEaSNUABM55_00272 [Erwinia phage pEa_SNUABM_55]|nr:hypothetical protein pEaSNUABM55_00272 [Erwinia phage pEa_SNUABM_55]